MSYTSQVFDRVAFAQKASETRSVVRILRSPTVVPRVQGGAVVMQPALVLTYSLEFADADMGNCSWVYRETVPENDRGEIDLTYSLLRHLTENSLNYQVIA